MVNWSSLSRVCGTNLLTSKPKTNILVHNVFFHTSKKHSHEVRTMAVQPSRFQYIKFKDMFHLYFWVGMIPVLCIIIYANVFIGPATLAPLPKDCIPNHWEYYRHPITRFIARYIHNNPQQEYEKFLHFLDEEQQKAKLRALEREMQKIMARKRDFKGYYWRGVIGAKYIRINREIGDQMLDRIGDNFEEPVVEKKE